MLETTIGNHAELARTGMAGIIHAIVTVIVIAGVIEIVTVIAIATVTGAGTEIETAIVIGETVADAEVVMMIVTGTWNALATRSVVMMRLATEIVSISVGVSKRRKVVTSSIRIIVR